MQNKTIRKIPSDHTLLGYAQANFKNQTFTLVGKSNALLILDKVSGFEDKKDNEIIEVSFEQVMIIMSKFGSAYAFNKITLDKFLNLIINLKLSDSVKKQIDEMRNWNPTDEEPYISISLNNNNN